MLSGPPAMLFLASLAILSATAPLPVAAPAPLPVPTPLPVAALASPPVAAPASPGLPLAVPAGPARSPGEAGSQEPTSRLRVFLLTFGPGAEVWERFGHNAIWIHDPGRGTDIAYHYGLFDMSEEGFLLNFLKGRMLYSMGAADAQALMDAYRQRGRSTTVQELALEEPRTEALRTFLEWNMRPENRVYRYDYFRDNCSTRVRDALDLALGGALSRALQGRETPITWRREALALTAEDQLLTAGMDLGMGPLADRGITRWDLAFIPMRLRDDVRTLTVDMNGEASPLVVMERELPAIGGRDESLAVARGAIDARVAWMLVIGLLGAALMVTLGWLATQGRDAGPARRVARWGLALTGSLWGLVAGVLGLILLGLWTLTDHEFAHANENLLQTSPVALALVVLVPLAVASGGRSAAAGAAFWTAAVLVGLSVLGLLVHPLPLSPQNNLGIIAVALPVHAGLLYALARLSNPRSRRPEAAMHARSLLLLLAIPALLWAPATPARAQDPLTRTPNLAGDEIGIPWTLHVVLPHRFRDGSQAEGIDLTRTTTFTGDLGLPWSAALGAAYAIQSPTVPGEPDELEIHARYRFLDGERAPAGAALTAAWNHAARSVDLEGSLTRQLGPLRVLAAARWFSDFRGAGTDRAALAAGAVWHPLPRSAPVALVGDVAFLPDGDEEPAWSAGAQVGIPHTALVVGIQATNTAATTLQGASLGDDRVRFGFDAHVPIPLGFFLGRYPDREAATAAVAEAPGAPADAVVEIRRYAYGPGRLVVRAGAVVEWVNRDEVVHTATAEDDAWGSGGIRPGQRWRARFDAPGTYPYYCGPHPFMKGVIVVR